MNTHTKKEILLAIGMLIIAGMCLFYAMSPMMYLGIHIIAITLFILFAIIIWTGKTIDEREYMHRALSSDIAFTVGGVMLGIAMIYQLYVDMHIDVWIVVTLAVMIIARVASQLWLGKNR